MKNYLFLTLLATAFFISCSSDSKSENVDSTGTDTSMSSMGATDPIQDSAGLDSTRSDSTAIDSTSSSAEPRQ